jgi:uncharacterized protein YjbJ (UPF0337 family)
MAPASKSADALGHGYTNYMTTLEIKGDWNITKGKLKQKWAKLTDNDLTYTEGQQEELLGRIQKITGETREMVESTIKEYSAASDGK